MNLSPEIVPPIFCHMQDSKGDGKLVSWEVWAALSELVVCRSDAKVGREDFAFVPPVTAAWIWQRAEEIRHSAGTITTDPAVDDNLRKGVAESGDREARSSAGFRGFGSGYGDISFWADDSSSAAERDAREERCAVVGTGTSATRTRPHQTRERPTSSAVRGRRPCSAPQTSNASKGRLHQTLATSRSSWSLRSTPQRQLRRGLDSARGDHRAPRRSSSSPSHRTGVACSASTSPNRKAEEPHPQRFWKRGGAEQDIPPLCSRPMTAPVESAVPRSGTKGPAHPTTCTRSGSDCQKSSKSVHEAVRTSGAGGVLMPNSLVRTLEGEAVADDDVSDFEWRGEERARDDMESGHLRTETASAKRKAAKYQTCMLEAQVHGGFVACTSPCGWRV